MVGSILIIEAPSNNLAVRFNSKFSGYDIVTAQSLQQAGALMEQFNFNLVLTDLNGNDRSGELTARAIREHTEAPVVIRTNDPLASDQLDQTHSHGLERIFIIDAAPVGDLLDYVASILDDPQNTSVDHSLTS